MGLDCVAYVSPSRALKRVLDRSDGTERLYDESSTMFSIAEGRGSGCIPWEGREQLQSTSRTRRQEICSHTSKKAYSLRLFRKQQNLLKELRYCTNPLSPKTAGALDYRKLSAVKVGGGFLRANFFSQEDRRKALHDLTAQVIGAYDSGAA